MTGVMVPLLVLALALPAALAATWPWAPLRRLGTALAPWAAAPALLLALLHLAEPNPTGVLEIPILETGIRLGVDAAGAAFLLFTAFLWLVAGVFAHHYHGTDPGRERFFAFFLLTMTGNLGLILAQELVTFYLFFALMTFSAWGLVVHRRDRPAVRAGRVYLTVAIAGELALMMGVLALGVAGGWSLGFGPELEAAWAALSGNAGSGGGMETVAPGAPLAGPLGSPTILAGLLVAGFAVKTGLAPLHIWLPLAHPVAPTAASALLSGVVIKAGLLGWIRVLPAGVPVSAVGVGLLVAGAATVLYGVAVGVAQDDAKTVLAYSSMSQMGYMGMGVGVGVMDPGLAPFALTATVVYALHHGVAKGSLFLSVGVGDRWVGPAPTPGWRRWAFFGGVAIPALALAGSPFTAGALAKGTLAEAAVGLAVPGITGLTWFLAGAAGGTTLLMARFLFVLHRRVRPVVSAGPRSAGSRRETQGMTRAWVVALAPVLAGPLWIAHVVPVPEGWGAPPLTYVPVTAWLPIVLAGVAAACVWLHPSLLGGFSAVRIPAGDLLNLVEGPVVRGLRRLWTGSEATPPAPFGGRPPEAGPSPEDRPRAGLNGLTTPERPPLSGPVHGAFVLGLVLILTLVILI